MNKNKQHHFRVDIAEKYGIAVAVILNNLDFWIEKNEKNEKNFHDGSYWTYNSIRAFNELFPYLSANTIRDALSKLEKNKIIKTGNYNKIEYDRTKWYTITKYGYSIINNSIYQNPQMELPKSTNLYQIIYQIINQIVKLLYPKSKILRC